MGTMRWQKERADREEQNHLHAEFARQNAIVEDEIEEMDARLKTLTRAIAAKQRTRAAMADREQLRHKGEELRHSEMMQLRQSEEPGSEKATEAEPPQKRKSTVPKR